MSGDRLENKSEKRCEYNVTHAIAPLLTFSHSNTQADKHCVHKLNTRARTNAYILSRLHTHTDARTLTR